MAIKIGSAHYGWLFGAPKGKDGCIQEVKWTKNKDSARPFHETRDMKYLQEVHAYLFDKGIMHDMVRGSIPWFDRQEN